MRRILKWGLIGLLAAFLVIQVLPFGRGHSNPTAHSEPPWDSPRTAELVMEACYDCHSNRTDWPWYSYVAPVSWLVTYDVYRAGTSSTSRTGERSSRSFGRRRSGSG